MTTAEEPVRLVFDRTQWFKAVDYPHLLKLLEEHNGKKIRLMGANTGTGNIQKTYLLINHLFTFVLIFTADADHEHPNNFSGRKFGLSHYSFAIHIICT